MLYVIDDEQARTLRRLTPGGARAGFQYVNEVPGAIEPYGAAMPLLAISNALISTPEEWVATEVYP
jgi:hypothetical protein